MVNTTPVGTYPNNGQSPVDLTVFPACKGVLDVVYNPRRTALLLQAESLAIPCCDGLPMLVAQAKAAEEHFFQRSIPDSETERILSQLRRETQNIVLIGMPGCGKSTVGAALAALTGREAIDIDQRIEARAGAPFRRSSPRAAKPPSGPWSRRRRLWPEHAPAKFSSLAAAW